MLPKMVRTPVEERLPWCYTAFRGDAACDACPHHTSCNRAAEAQAGRLTVAQAAAEAVAAYHAARGEALPLPEDLVAMASAVAGVPAYHAHQMRVSREWLRAMQIVIRSCEQRGWDPRTYVRAISEDAGRWAIEKGWALRVWLYIGDKAPERFERWAIRNARREGNARRDRRADPEREGLLAAECCFAERYMTDRAVLVVEAEENARGLHAAWSLNRTQDRPDVRLPALCAGLSALLVGLPQRMLMPAGPWVWPQAREAAWELVMPPEGDLAGPSYADLPPEMGESL